MAPEQARGTPVGRHRRRRHLRPGRHPLRDAHRTAAVQGLDAAFDPQPGGRAGAAAAGPLATASPARDRDHLPEVPGERPPQAVRQLHTTWPTTCGGSSTIARSWRGGSAGRSGSGDGAVASRSRRRSPPDCSLALIAGFLGVAAQKRRAEERALAEASQRARAELAETKALDNLYSSQIAQARLEWRLNNISAARQLLEQCDPRRRRLGVALPGGRRPSRAPDYRGPPGMAFVDAVAFSPDGRRFAFSASNPYGADQGRARHPVEVWETATPAANSRNSTMLGRDGRACRSVPTDACSRPAARRGPGSATSRPVRRSARGPQSVPSASALTASP